jgi:adenylate cyclase
VSASDLIHRLSAILAADAAGYSRLMSIDDKATVAALDAARAVFRTQIEAQQGRVIDMAGDSVLAVFGTATGAVNAALSIQAQINALAEGEPEDRRMRFRIGVHLGDLIEKADGTVYGDGVNIAARLQALADVGGVSVSHSIRGAVKGRVAAAFDDQGEQAVKNIADPVRAWRLRAGPAEPDATMPSRPATGAAPPNIAIDLSLPDKPSIAVLPFANMSGDPEQEYFTDGISEDIITELSRFKSLFVIARNSSFTYKGRSVDVRAVARELGVRYVLEGSIRKSGRRIRVTGQLIDAQSGTHLWAERYDRVLEDVFAVQEELTHSIVQAMAPFIEASEVQKAERLRPAILGAYEIALRAGAKAWRAQAAFDPRMVAEAIADAHAALAIDAASTRALGALAHAKWQQVYSRSVPDIAAAWQEGMAAACQAIELDRADHMGYTIRGGLLIFAPDRGPIEPALVDLRRAHVLNPHSAFTLGLLSFAEMAAGDPLRAIEVLRKALRNNPRDPSQFGVYNALAMASCSASQYAQGCEYALQGLREAPRFAILHGYLAANLAGLGEIAGARAAMDEARRCGAGWVQRVLGGDVIFRKPDDLRRVVGLLRIAAGVDDPSAADAQR